MVKNFSVDYIEMEKMYQKQFNTRERADFLKDFDLNNDGYVTMREIKQRIQQKKADLFKDFDLDGNGNIAIKEMITKLDTSIVEMKVPGKIRPARRRHYGYIDPTLASKAKERSVTAQLSAPNLMEIKSQVPGKQLPTKKFEEKEKEIVTKTSFTSQRKEVGQIVTRTSATTTTSFSKVDVTRAESK